jgi:hypothetical protein
LIAVLVVVRSKKTDPNGDYIRKWLPQFKNMPAKYIYEPWTAPLEAQRRYGTVGYTSRIVDHAVVSKSNMKRMKAAYDAHNQGGGGNQEGVVAAPEPGAIAAQLVQDNSEGLRRARNRHDQPRLLFERRSSRRESVKDGSPPKENGSRRSTRQAARIDEVASIGVKRRR